MFTSTDERIQEGYTQLQSENVCKIAATTRNIAQNSKETV